MAGLGKDLLVTFVACPDLLMIQVAKPLQSPHKNTNTAQLKQLRYTTRATDPS